METIQIQEVLNLSFINLLALVFLGSVAWFLAPKNVKQPLLIILPLLFLWSVVALLDYLAGDTGFFSWFLDPSAEKNFVAMLNSSLLLAIALIAAYLVWETWKHGSKLHTVYWLVLASLFLFLAADEYFSIHESISFWRVGYLGLGGTVGLLGILMAFQHQGEERKAILLFLLGLGIMGGSGVLLDSFSAEHYIEFGDFRLETFYCRGSAFGVRCFNYNNTEELLELVGAALMSISLLSYARLKFSPKQLGRIVLAVSGTWFALIALWLFLSPSIEVFFAEDLQADYGDIQLVAYSLNRQSIAAGDSLELTIYSRISQPSANEYYLSIHLYSQALPDIESIAQDDKQLGEFVFPSRAWIPYVPVRTQYRLEIPDDIELNSSYHLVAILWEGEPENAIQIQTSDRPSLDDGRVLILDGIAAPSTETINQNFTTRAYQFSTGIELTAYNLPESANVGEIISLDFWWRSSQDQSISMTQFLHFFHSETGDYFTFDQIPFAGRFPTSDWVQGMFVNDTWQVQIPETVASGVYRIQTGLFRTDNQERLPVTASDGQAVQDNSIILGTIEIND